MISWFSIKSRAEVMPLVKKEKEEMLDPVLQIFAF